VTVLHLFCQPQRKTSFRGGDAILVMGVIFANLQEGLRFVSIGALVREAAEHVEPN